LSAPLSPFGSSSVLFSHMRPLSVPIFFPHKRVPRVCSESSPIHAFLVLFVKDFLGPILLDPLISNQVAPTLTLNIDVILLQTTSELPVPDALPYFWLHLSSLPRSLRQKSSVVFQFTRVFFFPHRVAVRHENCPFSHRSRPGCCMISFSFESCVV